MIINYLDRCGYGYNEVLSFYSKKRKFILELGTGSKVSTNVFISNASEVEGHVWTVDVVDSKSESTKVLTYIVGNSLSVPWDQQIDLLYIDSNHHPDHVRKELERFSTFLWPGGVILLDAVQYYDKPTDLVPIVEDFCQKNNLEWFMHFPVAVIPITHWIKSDRVNFFKVSEIQSGEKQTIA